MHQQGREDSGSEGIQREIATEGIKKSVYKLDTRKKAGAD